MNTGDQELYAKGDFFEFAGWHPDGHRFAYSDPEREDVMLGHPCRPPVALGVPRRSWIGWADDQRFVALSELKGGGRWRLSVGRIGGPVTEIVTAKERPEYSFRLGR